MAVNSLMGSSVGLGVNSRGLRSGPGVGWGFLGRGFSEHGEFEGSVCECVLA